MTIEYVRPALAGAPSVPPPFRVTEVAHIVRPLLPTAKSASTPFRPGAGGARSIVGCHLDVSCYPEWALRDYPSVALIVITRGQNIYSCTGSLINPRFGRETHLLMLTAGHCIQSQDDAQNAVFTWNFQTTECYGSTTPPSDLISTTGATLLATRNDNRADVALLRLDSREVRSVTGVQSLGWSTGKGRSTGSLSSRCPIPDGAFKRISFGNVDAVNWTGRSSTNFTGIKWRQGTIEGGSSGAGVLRESDGRLIGVMVGASVGDEPCDSDFHGGFNHFSAIYDEISTYLNSEEAVSDRLPEEPVLIEVSLGANDGTITITANPDGTFWRGNLQVSDGSVFRSAGGITYRLVLSADGEWTAERVSRTVRIPLLGGSDSVTLTPASDGSYRLLGETGDEWLRAHSRRTRDLQDPSRERLGAMAGGPAPVGGAVERPRNGVRDIRRHGAVPIRWRRWTRHAGVLGQSAGNRGRQRRQCSHRRHGKPPDPSGQPFWSDHYRGGSRRCRIRRRRGPGC